MEGAGAHPAYEVAVVGHRGFLGGHIAARLESEGVRVRGFGSNDPVVVDDAPHPDLAGVRTVVWCAGRANPRLAEEDPALAAADVADLAQALDALRVAPPMPRIVLLSSGGTVYGPPANPPYRESDEPAPANAYARAKRDQELLLERWPGESVALRVGNAYGPGQVPAPGQGVLAHWIQAARAGEPLTLFGDPSSTRDYVHVDDVADAVFAVHRAEPAPPPVINIGSGRGTSLEELLAVFREAVAPLEVRVVRRGARSTDATHSVLDVTLAREVLGWRARVPLVEGIRGQWEVAR